MKCIVCKSKKTDIFYTTDKKTYWKCSHCLAKFLDQSHYLDESHEKDRYLEHQNEIGEPGYLKFLAKLSKPLKACLLYTSPSPRDRG